MIRMLHPTGAKVKPARFKAALSARLGFEDLKSAGFF
jgi:hypothetical protein